MYRVYLIKNKIDGKGYVGCTKHTLEHRLMEHWAKVHGGKDRYKNIELYKAMKENGQENFSIELLQLYENHTDALNGEIEHIKKYNTFFEYGHGYNMTLGGFGALGTKHSEEYKERMRVLNLGPNNPVYGRRTAVPKIKTKLVWEITSPNGEVSIVHNLQEFCNNNKLNRGSFYTKYCLRQPYKGYRARKIKIEV